MAQLNDLLVLGKASFLDAVKAPSFIGELTGNAATATALATAHTIFGKTFNGTQDVTGQPLVYGTYTSSASSRYANSGIQIRENGLVGDDSAKTDIGYAPSIGFHWGGRKGATLLFHHDGKFYLRAQDGTTRATLDANLVGNVTGNADTATNFSSAATINLIGDILGSASSTKGWEITTAIAHKTLDADYATKFRTEVKGDANHGSFIRTIRTNTGSIAGLPQYGSGLGWGGSDTHGYLYVNYNTSEAYIGGGNADKLNWKNRIALADGTNSFTGTNAFSGVVKISASNSYQNASQCKLIVGNSSSAFVFGGDGLQCYSDVWSKASNDTTALTGKVFYINYYGGGVTIGKSDRSATVTIYGTHAMDGVTNFSNGHVYLTDSNASSSVDNDTQLVFGTKDANHIALSANDNALVLNPTTSTTTNQIVFYLNSKSLIPSGIEVGSDSEFKGTVVFSKAGDISGTATGSPVLVIGGPQTGSHIEIDDNEIMAKASATTTGTLYLNNDGGLVQIGKGGLSVTGAATIGTTLTVHDQIYAKKNIYINSSAGDGRGLALYNSSAPTTYGIHMSTTSNFGVHGDVVSDWATYFNMDAVGQRGWIYRAGSTNVASISCNGIGTFNGIGNNGSYIAYPKGGTYTGASTETGYLRITLPVGFTSTMLKFKLSIYNYSTSTTVDYIISGYNYGGDSRWYNPTVTVLGQRSTSYSNLTVRFGSNGSKAAITIGEAGDTPTTWSYPNISISDVTLGHGRVYDDWQGDWTIDFTTTALTNITKTYANPYIGNFTGTTHYIPKFINEGRDLANSNITDDNSIITLGRSTIIKASASSYREGLRILPAANNGWALTFYSNSASSTSGTHDGGWLVGKRGENGTAYNGVTPIVGDFTIEEESSSGANLTIHKNSGGASLRGRFRTDNELQTSYANGLRIVQGNYGFILRNDGSSTYFLLTASKDQYGNWNGLRPFTINNSTGAVSMSNGLTVTNNASIKNLLTVGTGSSHYGIRAGDVYISSIGQNLILQNLGALRFGADSWDYNVWAGLKYDSSNKIIYLGLADGTVFTANNNQSGGTVALPGIRYFSINGKRVIDANDAWLRINENAAYASGVYFGTSTVRTDGTLQVGSGGEKFYANSSGEGFFRNTVRIGATGSTTSLSGNYCEGIRIQTPDSTWATIVLGGTGTTGTNTHAWSIHRKSDNNFCISKNSSDGANGLVMTTTGMGLGTTAPDMRLHVVGRTHSTQGMAVDTEGSGQRMLYGTTRNSGIKYDYNGRESLIISTGTYAHAGIQFFTANELSMSDSNGQWTTVTPTVHMLKKSLAINYNLTADPTYNLYVNGTSYFADTMTIADGKQIRRAGQSSSWYNGRDNAMIRQTTINGYSPIMSIKSTNGTWEMGCYDNPSYLDKFILGYKVDSEYTAGTPNSIVHALNLTKEGYLYLASGLSATTGTFSSNVAIGGTTTLNNSVYLNSNLYWKPNTNIVCQPTAANQEWSFDVGSTSYAGSYWHVWSAVKSATMLACYADTQYVSIPVHLYVGSYNNTSYALSTSSFICESWVRTTGATGWYNQTYGGGIYMEDSTWVRTYNGKNFYCSAVIGAGGRIYTGYDSGQTNSISCSNWFRSNGDTGWYNGDYGCHVRPNTVSSYGGLRVHGTRGGYHGILIGSANTGMTVMSIDGSHQGLFTESGTGWIIYNKNDSGLIALGGSSVVSGYKVATNGSHYVSGGLRVTSTSTLNGTVVANRGTSTAASNYGDAAIEVREYNFGGAQSDTWGVAPRISFHWSGRVAAQIGLASNGWLYAANSSNAGTGMSKIVLENSGTWGINITGNAGSATSAKAISSTGYGNGNFTWYQTDGSFAGNSGWSSYLVSNHGDGSSYYHQIIALPFWGVPKYRRMMGSTSNTAGWYDFITDENAASKTVGNADTVDGYHAASFAFQASHNNLTASGNEFTFASSAFSGSMYVNYRTAGGTNGAITEYRFCNGAGALTAITATNVNASGNITATNGYIWANGGYLYTTANGNELLIGSQNTAWTHFQSSSDRPFYFNRRVYIDGHLGIYECNANGTGSTIPAASNRGQIFFKLA